MQSPRTRGGTIRPVVLRVALCAIVAFLVLPSAISGLGPASPLIPSLRPDTGIVAASQNVPTISDDQFVPTSSPSASVLHDSIGYAPLYGNDRIYWINLTASVALPSVSLMLETAPLEQWGLPLQVPGGVDNLPPLSMWNWTIYCGRTVDTSSWSGPTWNNLLTLSISWTNQSYEVVGSTAPFVTVTVNSSLDDGTTAPGDGFVMNLPGVAGAIPPNDPTFQSLASALHPSIVRIGSTVAQFSYQWNTVTNQP
ncbi:MAG: hypothetical protein WBW40_08310, partial [Thermoplasmata archaeon]